MTPPPSSCRSFTALLLVHVQDSVAAGAGVVGVLEVFQEKWNQAAAQHQPEAHRDTRAETDSLVLF